jgi:hypothetical protein
MVGCSHNEKNFMQINRFVASGFSADRSGCHKSADLWRYFRRHDPYSRTSIQQWSNFPACYGAPAYDKDVKTT